MPQTRSIGIALIFCAVLLKSGSSFAYGLSPRGTELEQRIAAKNRGWIDRQIAAVVGVGLPVFTAPVHEEITQLIFGCTGDPADCQDPDIGYASPYVMAGVRWNDDPPFRLFKGEGRSASCKTGDTIRFTTQPACWAVLFKDAEKRASAGERFDMSSQAPLVARSHFGDLQFLHAMASRDGETAAETKTNIMMWAEFTWDVATRKLSAQTALSEVPVEGFDKIFGKSPNDIQILFALGNEPLRKRTDEVALGSLLHMVEDSFARGHVDRSDLLVGKDCAGLAGVKAPGRIAEFHSYTKQDHTKHASSDSRAAFVATRMLGSPSVVDVGKTILQLYERDPKPSWAEARPYFDCIFDLVDPLASADPGADFRP